MADPHRLDAVLDEAADRDSRAEALLLAGLDRYFAGQFEDAIHLWTRVLFLDRAHPRARAYIDRARTAIAERQRRADEMLQTTRDLVSAGQTSAARELLDRAIATVGDDDQAAEVRARLERVERARAEAIAPARQAVVDVVPIDGRRRVLSWPIVAGALAAGAVVIAGVALARAGGWIGEATVPTLTPVARPIERPVLSTSEVALVRARTLYARGRLAEALRALDRVNAEGPLRQDADRLRGEIQQLLLATGRGAFTSADSDRGRP
jgi:tetratricopeptide (TPR) repeat protein